MHPSAAVAEELEGTVRAVCPVSSICKSKTKLLLDRAGMRSGFEFLTTNSGKNFTHQSVGVRVIPAHVC